MQAPNTAELWMIGKNSQVAKKHILNPAVTPNLVNKMQTNKAIEAWVGSKKANKIPKKPPRKKDKQRDCLTPIINVAIPEKMHERISEN